MSIKQYMQTINPQLDVIVIIVSVILIANNFEKLI